MHHSCTRVTPLAVWPYAQVHDTWTIEEAVPFWYICENGWRGHVDCKAAYAGAYDRRDYYGWETLSACLQQPETLMRERDASGGSGGGGGEH